MKKLNLFRLTVLITFALIMHACDVSMQLEMPEGPQGPKGDNGFSAYELWLQEVGNGNINWNGGTGVVDFFLYLKGKDGANGADGINGTDGADGINGLSAYELWIEQVNTGTMNDPHNPGTYWPTENTSMVYFWYYLTGANGTNGTNGTDGTNGLSAWELWVIEVEKGLEDPHNPGYEWDKNKTTLDDFWEYLKGRDGANGNDGKDGEVVYEDTPGKEGEIIEIETGKYNVIPQFAYREYNEYVNATTGTVTFYVYGTDGLSVGHGIEVTNMPGVDNPAKIHYTQVTNVNGVEVSYITLERDDLCNNKLISQRKGACMVNGVESAENTYVPNRVDVRARVIYNQGDINSASSSNIPFLQNSTTSYNSYQSFKVITERHTYTTGSDWEVIPAWITFNGSSTPGNNNSAKRRYRYFRCKKDDPYTYYNADGVSAPPANGVTGDMSGHSVNVFAYSDLVATTVGGASMYITRPMKPCDYMNVSGNNVWDGMETYGTVVCTDLLYGLANVQADAVIQFAPVQFMPYVNFYETGKLTEETIDNNTYYYYSKIQGTFAISGDTYFGVTKVDKDIIYERNFTEETVTAAGKTFFRYSPQKVDWDTAIELNLFYIRITVGVHMNGNDNENSTTIANRKFAFTTPYSAPASGTPATFELISNTPAFRSIGKCGDFYHTVDGQGNVTSYIRKRTVAETNGYAYTLKDRDIATGAGVVTPLTSRTTLSN